MSTLSNLYPKKLWSNFESICAIPHPSKHEKQIAQYIANWAEKHGLKVTIDSIGNVIIKKPATKGMENRKGVIFQGHLDMVPQKNSDTTHDFEKDPISPFIDGEWVKAKGTTLGADNGIGVAAAMAILESDDIAHGPLEALFTIDEETGMTGAFGLKPGLLDGDILINLDTEDIEEICIGCAGGLNTNITMKYETESVPSNSVAYKISLTGLKGGHSGIDINLGRGNANKLMIRHLYNATQHFGLRLASIEGGSLRNAIPREAFAIVTIPQSKEKEYLEYAAKYAATIASELNATEPTLKFEVTKTNMPSQLIDIKTQNNLIRAVYTAPNGPITMSVEMEGVVETSTNLAIIKSNNGIIEITSLQRSQVDSLRDSVGEAMRAAFELTGASVEHNGAYPGWRPNFNSSILKTMKTIYKNKFGSEPHVKVVHAGLECGIIGSVYPKLELISCGPTICFPHSPDEKVNIASVGKFWDYLVETLKNIPTK